MYYENFEELCKLNNERPSDVSKATGIATSTLTEWKKGRYTPKQDKLQLIADHFGVTLERLMRGKTGYYLNEETAALAQEMFEDADMRSLYDMKRNMSLERFQAHMNYMKELYRQEHPEYDDGC